MGFAHRTIIQALSKNIPLNPPSKGDFKNIPLNPPSKGDFLESFAMLFVSVESIGSGSPFEGGWGDVDPIKCSSPV